MDKPPGTTPFPNFLLDMVRPQLRGSEWNVLCLIVRQTCGWSDGKGVRKQHDWLTHEQLKDRTGLASASVCRAIDTLVRKKLITVRDDSGQSLLTAAERRRAGRLHFALCSTEQSNDPKVLEAAFQKAKTTKESNNTNTFVDFRNEKARRPFISKNEKLRMEDASPKLMAAVTIYERQFRQRQGAETMPAIGEPDLVELQLVLEKHGTEKLERMLERFFASEAHIIRRQGYSLRAFTSTANFLDSR